MTVNSLFDDIQAATKPDPFEIAWEWGRALTTAHVHDGRDVARTLIMRCFDGLDIDASVIDPQDTVDVAIVKAKREIRRALDETATQDAAATPRPNARDVGRYGDMSQQAHLRVGIDNENDVYVSVWDERAGASVEFCVPGSGGGKSPRTREALIALMVAIEQDNAECPSRDWWARRLAGASPA